MTQNLEARSRAESTMIRKAWVDDDFKKALLSDPKSSYAKAYSEAGDDLPEGTEVRVLEEQEGTLYLVIPNAPVEAVGQIDDRSTRGEFEASLINSAQNDAEAKAKLFADPRGAYEAQLAVVREGAKLPEDMKIEVYEESDKVLYFRLPQAPAASSGELSDDELEEVAGGKQQAGIAVGAAVVSTVVVGAVIAAVLL